MRFGNLLLLAGIAAGAVVGIGVGLLFRLVDGHLTWMPFVLGAFCSYIGMLLADRQRLRLRRAAAQAVARGTQPSAVGSKAGAPPAPASRQASRPGRHARAKGARGGDRPPTREAPPSRDAPPRP